MKSFDELVDDAAAVPVEGWDFSWLDGRATEQRPSWGYQRLLGGKLAAATAGLDIQTGGGEVLVGAGAENFPPTLLATEGWPPNLAKATALLHPLGAAVVADREEPPLPFADGAFDLVTSRHPATVHWSEIARVLAPGGTYFAQHVGNGTNVEISEYFLGPLDPGDGRHHEVEADQARASKLEFVQCRNERLQLEFFDVGAMVFFLRKVVWTVPDSSSDRSVTIHEPTTTTTTTSVTAPMTNCPGRRRKIPTTMRMPGKRRRHRSARNTRRMPDLRRVSPPKECAAPEPSWGYGAPRVSAPSPSNYRW